MAQSFRQTHLKKGQGNIQPYGKNNPGYLEHKKGVSMKAWTLDQETRKSYKEHQEGHGAGTDTEPAKGQSTGTKTRNISMDKRRGQRIYGERKFGK